MTKRKLDIDILRAGQARAYAPSIYEARLTLTHCYRTDGAWTPLRLSEQDAKSLFRMLVQRDWKDAGEPTAWHEARLVACEREAENQWRLCVERPYLD